MKLQGGKRIACQLLALAAFVIGVPDDAAFVIALDQHDARAGTHITADSGHGHCIGLGYLGTHSFLQPLIKLLQRICIGSGLTELCALIALAQVCDGRR